MFRFATIRESIGWSFRKRQDQIEARSLAENLPDLKIGIAHKKASKLESAVSEFRNFFWQEIGVHRSSDFAYTDLNRN
jgi:hypothetical protein